jgi:hypothetical protein
MSLVLVAVALPLIGGVIGWWINNAFESTPQVHAKITDSFTGTITQVSLDQTVGCVTALDSKHEVCSRLMPIQDGANRVRVEVGSRVRAARETLYIGGGNGFDMLLLYPA